jgi:hypothetical protein
MWLAEAGVELPPSRARTLFVGSQSLNHQSITCLPSRLVITTTTTGGGSTVGWSTNHRQKVPVEKLWLRRQYRCFLVHSYRTEHERLRPALTKLYAPRQDDAIQWRAIESKPPSKLKTYIPYYYLPCVLWSGAQG